MIRSYLKIQKFYVSHLLGRIMVYAYTIWSKIQYLAIDVIIIIIIIIKREKIK